MAAMARWTGWLALVLASQTGHATSEIGEHNRGAHGSENKARRSREYFAVFLSRLFVKVHADWNPTVTVIPAQRIDLCEAGSGGIREPDAHNSPPLFSHRPG